MPINRITVSIWLAIIAFTAMTLFDPTIAPIIAVVLLMLVFFVFICEGIRVRRVQKRRVEKLNVDDK
ncbi:MAG TPA: hypothetical protein VFW73_10310 [Lacipirellulaceae bacterium]|nr:hypothetical protein [Lacipirellulaceae bacterium]